MSTAKQFREAIDRFMNPERAIRELTDEQLRTAVMASVEVLKTLKAEAVRRGIWESWKKI